MSPYPTRSATRAAARALSNQSTPTGETDITVQVHLSPNPQIASLQSEVASLKSQNLDLIQQLSFSRQEISNLETKENRIVSNLTIENSSLKAKIEALQLNNDLLEAQNSDMAQIKVDSKYFQVECEKLRNLPAQMAVLRDLNNKYKEEGERIMKDYEKRIRECEKLGIENEKLRNLPSHIAELEAVNEQMKREGTQLNTEFEKKVMECKRLEKECSQIVELQGFVSQMKEEGSNLQMELEKKVKECERLERENEDLKNMGAEYEKLYDELDRIVMARKSVTDRLKDLFCGPKPAGSG